MKKLFVCFTVLLAMLSPAYSWAVEVAALAAESVPGVDLIALIQAFAGESAPVWIGWISFVLVIWSQLRQLISPTLIARLPRWVIWVLEFAAANFGKSRNDYLQDPLTYKKRK
ncbi:hypothetical protein LH205_003218 [Vibrio cholerae]